MLISFSGYQWGVRDGEGGPGPNKWRQDNIWVDNQGLHLKIRNNGGQWSCAEIYTIQPSGFGTYQFQVVGQIDKFDSNVVLGMFNYPTSAGLDETNEIDIEIARWGSLTNDNGNYVVWPAQKGLKQNPYTFNFNLNGDYTTHRFKWQSQEILFQSLHGHTDEDNNEFAKWLFDPEEYTKYIPQQPLPIHINLWLFKGKAPNDTQEIEVIIKNFKFIPL
jgi:hypothetical protein